MKKRIVSFLLSLLMIISLTPSVLLTSMEVNADVTPSVSDSYYVNENLSAVKNQGSLGLCWAFSTIAACETELIQNNGASTSIDLSELHLAYFGFNRSADPLGNYSAGKNQLQDLTDPSAPSGWESRGHNQYAAINALAAWSGAVTEETTPYINTAAEARAYFDNQSADELAALSYNNNAYHLENAYMIDRNNPEDIKQAILDYGGVIVGISADSGMLELSSQYDATHHSFYHPNDADTDHEVLIVGWDDDFNAFDFSGPEGYTPVTPQNSGAWLIKNSWGTSAGDEGYFWMSYEDETMSRWLYAYDMEPASNFDNNYQYNNDISGVFSGEVTSDIYDYTPKNNSKWAAANVFTIKANPDGYETLNAVSFMTYAPNGNYTIKIYTDLLDESSPESGTLKATLTGSYKYAGYHTIRTDSPIPLAEGTNVSICVNIVDDNGKQLGIAGVENSLGIDAAAKEGQSFLAEYGAWYDRSKTSQSVVAIKAFTKNVSGTTPTAISFAKEDYYISTTGNGDFVHPTITGATHPALTWSSSDTDVATVLSNGKIKPVAAGDCTITATTSNDLSASFTVHVVEGPPAITYVSSGSKAWLKDDNTDGYYILASPTETGTRVIASRMLCDGSNQYEADVSSLTEGYSYYVWVQPFKLYGEDNDIEILGPVGQYEYRYYSIAYTSTIANFRVTAKTSTSVTLKWDPFSGVDHYEIAYSDSSYHSINVYDESYTVTGLQPGTTYTFKVRGVGPTMLAREVRSTFVSKQVATYDSSIINELVYNTQKNGFTVSSKEELITAITVLQDNIQITLKDETGKVYKGATSANIILTDDIALGEKTIAFTDVTLNLYLDGNTLSSTNECVYTVTNSNIKVYGGDCGKIQSTHSGSANDLLIYQKSGTMLLSDCVLDYTNTAANNMIQVDAGQLTLTNVDMHQSSCNTLIYVIATSDASTSVTLNNCDLTSDHTAIQSDGGKVTINGGDITTKGTAIVTKKMYSVPVDLTVKGDAEIIGYGGTSTASSVITAGINAGGPINIQSGHITGFNVGVLSTSDITISGGLIDANRVVLSVYESFSSWRYNASIGLLVLPSSNDSTRTIKITGGDFTGMLDNNLYYDCYGIYNRSAVSIDDFCGTGYQFNEAASENEHGLLGYVYCSAESATPRTCNIVYDLSGQGAVDATNAVNSSNNPSSYVLGYGTINLEAPTLTGKVFDGWYTLVGVNNGTWYHDYIDTSNPTSTTTFYASWRNPYYYINFDKNGGTGSMSSQYCEVGSQYTLNSNSYTRTGYIFQGWNTKRDGSGTPYSNKATFTNLTSVDQATVTLYAQWKAITYKIAFNANGGTGTLNAMTGCKYNTSYTLPACTFTRNGYTFAGWSTTATGTVKYTDKANVNNLTSTNNATVTLYAVWTENTYTIAFHANGGTGSLASMTGCKYSSTYTLSANSFTRKGYTFAGWSTTATGTVKYANKASVKSLTSQDKATVTLYAVWTENTYTIAFDANGGTGTLASKTGCKYSSTYTLPANKFTRKGYTFAGWSTSKTGSVKYANKAKVKSLTSKDKSTVTLYAVWTKTKYTITYKLNGGKNAKDNPTSYYVTTSTITLKAPTRKGYKFMGWYTSSSYKTKITSIKKGSTGNKTLYAKWKKN